MTIIIAAVGACSDRQTKSNTKNTKDRSSSLSYDQSIAFLESSGDTLTTIRAAVADEPSERNEGLMDVNNLPKDRGMLFIFEEQEELSFWMANTPLPLDIMFVNKDKEIVRIHHSTQPFAQKNFTSGQPALYAIETNSGFAISHDIKEGMKVNFQIADSN